MDGERKRTREVLGFWFLQSRPRQWFAKNPAFDALLRERFLGLTRRALRLELDAWDTEAAGGQRSGPRCGTTPVIGFPCQPSQSGLGWAG